MLADALMLILVVLVAAILLFTQKDTQGWHLRLGGERAFWIWPRHVGFCYVNHLLSEEPYVLSVTLVPMSHGRLWRGRRDFGSR